MENSEKEFKINAFFEAFQIINSAIQKNISSINVEGIKKFISYILKAKHIFVVAVGRSGLVSKAFAMRLIHLGKQVSIVGDITTPAITKENLLIAISGSGQTEYVTMVVKKAKSLGATVISITSFLDSPVAKNSDFALKIEGKEKRDDRVDYFAGQLEGKYESLAPMGTLFEISTLVFLDCVIAQLASYLGKSENDMKSIHSNLE